MNYKIKTKIEQGLNPIVSPSTTDLTFLNFGVLSLPEGKEYSTTSEADCETVLIILSGNCNLEIDGELYDGLGQREGVFDGKATAAFLPTEYPYTVEANSDVEVAVVEAPAENDGDPQIIMPEDIEAVPSGRDTWERSFHKIIMDNVDSKSLFISETFNQPGKWSSYPPHRHDIYNPPEEMPLEELYFYRLQPEQGFGMQRIYTQDRGLDEAYAVEHNDTVIFPKGYHPTCAAPGYDLYYLWLIAGEERVLEATQDPDHAWVAEE